MYPLSRKHNTWMAKSSKCFGFGDYTSLHVVRAVRRSTYGYDWWTGKSRKKSL